jgi:putative NADH-flavin reductase
MRIALLGATGNTGIQLAIQACQRNHQVTAIVRNPDKLATYKDKNLTIVKANNIFDADELASHLTGHDCVLSSLGYHGVTLSAVSICSDGIKSITAAMRKSGIKRLLCVSSQYSKRK